MLKAMNLKTVLVVASIIAVVGFAIDGLAGDHFGDYLKEHLPYEYETTTGWRRVVGDILLLGFLIYGGRQIYKMWRG